MNRYFVMSMGKDGYEPGLHMIASTRNGLTKEEASRKAEKLASEARNGEKFFVGTVTMMYEQAPSPVKKTIIPPTATTFDVD